MHPVGFHHLAIQVTDLASAERFYTQVLGLPVLRRWLTAGGDAERSVWLDTGDGGFLALEKVPPRAADNPDDPASPGHHLLALRIPRADRAAWVARLAAAQVAVYKQTGFTIYVRDPEGNRIGLSHWPDPQED